jgi:GR25 family glycosyltransferase involved in LPS biosynthesis
MSSKPVKLRICFGVFHIENDKCDKRHVLKDQLIYEIGSTWANLEIDTYHFNSMIEAHKLAQDFGLDFDHVEKGKRATQNGFIHGEIGLWIGIIVAVKKFLESDFDILVLFEDDIALNDDAIEVSNRYLINPPRRFEVFALYTPEEQFHIYGRKRHIWSFLRKRLNDNLQRPTRIYQDHCTSAIAISRYGGEKLLASIESGIKLRVDRHLFKTKFRAYSFKPNGPKPFSMADLDSTIDATIEL